MTAKKQSRVQSWPRWIASTVAGLLVSAFMAIAGSISEFVCGVLAALFEGLGMVSAVVLAPLALLEACE